MLKDFMREYKLSFCDVIFNEKYVIFTDSDEDPKIWDMLDQGIITLGTETLKDIYPHREDIYIERTWRDD